MSRVRRLVRFVLVPLVVVVATAVGTGAASADTIWNVASPKQAANAAAQTPAPAIVVAQDTIWN